MSNLRKEEIKIMRLIYLPTFWTIVIDFIAWLIIHIGVVAIIVKSGETFQS